MTGCRRVFERTGPGQVRHRRRTRHSHVINARRNLQLRRQLKGRSRNTIRSTLRTAISRLIPFNFNNGVIHSRLDIRRNRWFHQFRKSFLTNRMYRKYSTAFDRVPSRGFRNYIFISTRRKYTRQTLATTRLRSQRYKNMVFGLYKGMNLPYKRRSRAIGVTICRQLSTLGLHNLVSTSTRRRLLQVRISSKFSFIGRLHTRQIINNQGRRTSNINSNTTRHTHHVVSQVIRIYHNHSRTTYSIIIFNTFTKGGTKSNNSKSINRHYSIHSQAIHQDYQDQDIINYAYRTLLAAGVQGTQGAQVVQVATMSRSHVRRWGDRPSGTTNN